MAAGKKIIEHALLSTDQNIGLAATRTAASHEWPVLAEPYTLG